MNQYIFLAIIVAIVILVIVTRCQCHQKSKEDFCTVAPRYDYYYSINSGKYVPPPPFPTGYVPEEHRSSPEELKQKGLSPLPSQNCSQKSKFQIHDYPNRDEIRNAPYAIEREAIRNYDVPNKNFENFEQNGFMDPEIDRMFKEQQGNVTILNYQGVPTNGNCSNCSKTVPKREHFQTLKQAEMKDSKNFNPPSSQIGLNREPQLPPNGNDSNISSINGFNNCKSYTNIGDCNPLYKENGGPYSTFLAKNGVIENADTVGSPFNNGCRRCGGDYISVAPKRDMYYQMEQGYLGSNLLSGYNYYPSAI